MAEFPDWLLQRKDFRAILDSKSEPWLYALRKKPYNRDGKDKKALVDWIKEGPMAPELKKLAMDPVVIADMIIVRTYDGAQSGSASVICQEADEPGTLYMLLKGEALASSERTGANEKPSSRRTINASRKKKLRRSRTSAALLPTARKSMRALRASGSDKPHRATLGRFAQLTEGSCWGAVAANAALRGMEVRATRADTEVACVQKLMFEKQRQWDSIALLRKLPLFHEWSTNRLLSLTKRCVSKVLKPGDIVVRQGEAVDGVYVVQSGTLVAQKTIEELRWNCWPAPPAPQTPKDRPSAAPKVKQYRQKDAGRHKLKAMQARSAAERWEVKESHFNTSFFLNLIREGEMLGGPSCLPNSSGTRTATVRAVTDAQVLFIAKQDFLVAISARRSELENIRKLADVYKNENSGLLKTKSKNLAGGPGERGHFTRLVESKSKVYTTDRKGLLQFNSANKGATKVLSGRRCYDFGVPPALTLRPWTVSSSARSEIDQAPGLSGFSTSALFDELDLVHEKIAQSQKQKNMRHNAKKVTNASAFLTSRKRDSQFAVPKPGEGPNIL